MQIKYIIRSLVIIISLLMLNCCSQIERRNISLNNPTSFVFEASVSDVKKAVINAFSKQQYRGMELFHMGTDSYYKFEPILNKPGNKNDFYLDKWGNAIGKSKLFFKNSKALDYVASFHLHLIQIDSTKTEVKVFTHDPKIIIGKQLIPLAHGTRPFKYETVEPSTIEEYEILLKIGKQLGEKNMPRLNL